MGRLSALCVSYGAQLHNRSRGKKTDKLAIFIEKTETSSKVFNQQQFDGSNFMRKRKFITTVDPITKSRHTVYDGFAEVIVSINTPIK